MFRRWPAGALALIAAVTLVGCGSTSRPAGTRLPTSRGAVASDSGAPSDDVPSRAPATRGSATHDLTGSCDRVPASSGPLGLAARLSIQAPTAGASGRTVAVSVAVTSSRTAPRVVTTPATSAVLVLRGDQVVGRTPGAPNAPPIPLTLSAGARAPAQAVPSSVRLTDCDDRDLPAGSYLLVAVLGYRLDPLNAAPAGGSTPPAAGGRQYVLASSPTPITVS